MDKTKLTEEYNKASQELRDAVEDWLKLLDDPFKPPELKTGLPQNIGSLCFKQASLYHALCNYG